MNSGPNSDSEVMYLVKNWLGAPSAQPAQPTCPGCAHAPCARPCHGRAPRPCRSRAWSCRRPRRPCCRPRRSCRKPASRPAWPCHGLVSRHDALSQALLLVTIQTLYRDPFPCLASFSLVTIQRLYRDTVPQPACPSSCHDTLGILRHKIQLFQPPIHDTKFVS